MEYFDITSNPKTGRIVINLGEHLAAVTFENGDRVQIIQEPDGAVMIDKKVLLDLEHWFEAQEA